MQKKSSLLKEVFDQVKPLIKKYEPHLAARMDFDSRYELWSEKNVFFAGKQRDEVFFVGLIIQSNYVGFYYMPIYCDPTLKNKLKPELLKLLKGKSCFHLKTVDKVLMSQIKDALKIGFDFYKKQGWV